MKETDRQTGTAIVRQRALSRLFIGIEIPLCLARAGHTDWERWGDRQRDTHPQKKAAGRFEDRVKIQLSQNKMS